MQNNEQSRGSINNGRKPKHTKEANSPTFQQKRNEPGSTYVTPVFFWKEDGENGFLCQWYRCTFTDPESGVTFTCAEQWMMYQKALAFNDTDIAVQILKTSSPRKQKGLGSQVANFSESEWSQIRSGIVEKGNVLKFSQCSNVTSIKMDDVSDPEPLKNLLLATGNRELVEASPFDRVWGIGFRAGEALGVPRVQWGENLLGKALMKVRDELRSDARGETVKS